MARPFDSRIESALAAVSPGVAWDTAGIWRLALSNGAVTTVQARVTSEWLRLSCPVPADTEPPDDRWSLLLNADMTGAARLVRPFADLRPHIRADVPLESDDLCDGVRRACLDLGQARHLVHAGGPDGRRRVWSSLVGDRPEVAEMQRAAAETGWSCTLTDSGEARVSLPTRDALHHARLEASDDGTRVIVELANLEGYTPHAVRAASALLVAVGAAVPGAILALHERRRVKTAICQSPVARPVERHLPRALLAVTAACELAGRELAALRDPGLAAAYIGLTTAVHFDNPRPHLEERP
jgi:hypothetical protein